MPVRVRLRAPVALLRWLRWLLLVAALLVFGALITLRLFLTTERGSRWMRLLIVETLSNALHTDVRIGSFQMSGIATLEVHHLSIDDLQCQPFLQISRLFISWRPGLFWQGFWKGSLLIPLSTVEIEKPFFYLYHERTSGLLNLDRLFPPDTTPPSQTQLNIRIPQLSIHNGTFIFRDSTAPDSALQTHRGFMNYANLQLAHLHLSASVELHGKRLFAYVRHLSVADTAANVQVDTLLLVLRAYPDSTVIDDLFLHMGASQLKGYGKFLHEGLNKLFLNTDTKQFVAVIGGNLEWRDIAALSGDTLPLRGLWHIKADLEGDLLRFRWKRLFIETAAGMRLETAGEIWHYAKPKLLYWDVRVREGIVSLGTLGAALPDVAGWPENWDTLRLWPLKGRSIGSLHSYWFQVQLPGAQVHYTMEKTPTDWEWYGKVRLSGWSVSDLIRDVPIEGLYGELEARGEGFDWKSWTGTLQVGLSGVYDTLTVRRFAFSAEAAAGQWSGEMTLNSSLIAATVRGSSRLTESPSIQLLGDIRVNCWWGAPGSLAGSFQINLTAPSWDKLHGQVVITHLIWEQPDTILSLGDLQVNVLGEGPFQVLLASEHIQAQAIVPSSWKQFLRELDGIATAAQRWAIEKVCPALPETITVAPFELRLNLDQDAWPWLHLAGFSRWLSGGAAKASLSWNAQNWQVQLQMDSLILPTGDLHAIKFHARGQWRTSWPFSAEVNIGYGEQYMLFQDLAMQIEGAYPEGKFQVVSLIGYQDSLRLRGQWEWPGGEEFHLRLLAEESSFTLAGQHWRFPEAAQLSRADTSWQWHLLVQADQARLSTQNTPSGIRAEGQNIPIRPLIAILGEDWPLEGLLALHWTQEQSHRLTLHLSKLAYAGQTYPDLQLSTYTHQDTLPIQFTWGNDPDRRLTGTGYYALSDTIAPLFLKISGSLPAAWLSEFTNDYLEGLGGHLRFPRLIVRGSLSHPQLVGDILLDKVRAYLPILRLSYTADGIVKCRGDTVWVMSLPLSDPAQKLAFLEGYIALRSWSSPYLALSLHVKEGPVRVLATRPASDAYLYGQALIERGEIRMEGPWDRVRVRGFLRFAEGTELTLPVENYLRTEKRSYVRFVGRQDTLRPILQVPGGLSLQVSLLSAPTARFRVLFDSRTGDEIVAAGTSNLSLRITPEGTVTISGSYEVSVGEYRLSLRGIVARTLRIETGSRITWDGDLYQGRLQITATYRTFTSLRMIDSTYTATVPVEVRLLLGGNLLSPELRFQVDIPNLTGNPSPLITLFLQRLQNDEQERNRQVFALLALGTLLPPEQGITPAQTTSGVSTTLSEFLSAQLSGLVGQLLGSQIGIGFSMGQWNEVSTQVRLSLGGRLTIQREGVLIGPGQTNPTLGNLSTRYRILPPRLTSPTQLQLEAEAFNRQTFFGGSFGSSTQGVGMSVRKSFFLPARRRRHTP